MLPMASRRFALLSLLLAVVTPATAFMKSLQRQGLERAAKCPGSQAEMHAMMQVTADAAVACSKARAEMLARVKSQGPFWHDPHNNGTYSIVDESRPRELTFSRLTGDRLYTDKMTFVLEPAGDAQCTIYGCSESQGPSVADFSTNYCNLRMLYCGSVDGCKPVLMDFTSVETFVGGSEGATKNPLDCLKV
eukprot:CAMPEP_0197872092 /NCGR_PEP_ID=MMETSP1439-20131203/2297_1 /TAXON_ID=66791 /ORGANISM="Gonyaulax spinifera, Strain CCMP409" /LENGTH=190 /DNA_ID=CAMNT_0043491063 /DNA_START=60 /DNA_END=632 /DNA_ORIENTATION=+